MPFDPDGTFTPRPWKPLAGDTTLFDVAPPGHPDEDTPATPEDLLWFRLLRDVTARAVRHIVTEVDHNHSRRRGVKFVGQGLGKLLAYLDVIAYDLLAGEPGATAVGDELKRLAKTFGLVAYDPEPGLTYNWPMAKRLITVAEAQQIVEDAFWGRWPAPGGDRTLGSPQP